MRTSTRSIQTWAMACLLAAASFAAPARAGTTFTYQGRLTDSGAALDDLADVQFTLFDAEIDGNAVGATVDHLNYELIDGLINAELDFGAGAFNGNDRWLEIAVRTPPGTGAYVILTPRVKIDAAPYAQHAETVGLVSNSAMMGTFTNPVSFQNAGNDYAGDGAALSNLNASSLSSGVLSASRLPTGGSWTLGSTLNLDFNTFAVDAVNNRVGIGTSAPVAALDVVGNVRAQGAGAKFTVSNPNNIAATVNLDWLNNVARIRVGGSGTGASNGLDIQTVSDNSLLRVTGAGNVGIKNAAPETRLHVLGGTDVGPSSGGYLQLGSTTSTNIGVDNNEIMARNNGAPTDLFLQNEGGDVVISQAGNSTLSISDTVELMSSEGGSDGAQMRLYDAAGTATFELDAEEGGGGSVIFMRNSLNAGTVEIDSDESGHSALRLDNSAGSERIVLKSNVSSAGWVALRGGNGNYNVVLTRENASENHGWIDVSDANGNPQAGAYVNSSGNGVVWGDTKNFRVPHPNDPELDIVYASLEGPEAAMYVRGTAALVNGAATIDLPEHFTALAAQEGMTVHLTSLSADSRGLAVVQKGTDVVAVRELMNGSGTYAFDWEIKAVRRAHQGYEPVRRWDEQMPARGLDEDQRWAARLASIEQREARMRELEARLEREMRDDVAVND